MDTVDVAQGSAEWHAARTGSLGASCLHEVMARTKSGWSASRANRLATLVVERLTGVQQDTFQSAAMVHGVETEPDARAAYEFYSGVVVEQVGLVRHPRIKGTHASPDGLVGDDGLVEIKCPQPAGHLTTLMGGAIPDKYVIQMQWQMRCCDRAWCDFVSYSPLFPEDMRLWSQRVHRDDKRIAELEDAVTEFLAELDATVAALMDRYDSETKLRATGGHLLGAA